MPVSADERPYGLNGHQLLGGHANGDRTVLITKPRHFFPWLARQDRPEPDRAARWLRAATFALGLLAAAAAAVSFQAQYQMIYRFKHSVAIAALQAGIPDAGAVVFACLGIALALRGKQAVRPRVLNVACVGISIAMNALASSTGMTALAVWVMAPVLYTLASDTLISVIRSIEAGDEITSLAVVGRVVLWSLRFAVAPRSTASGARRMVLAATPLPGLPSRAQAAAELTDTPQLEPPPTGKARLLALYRDHPQYGDTVNVSQVAAELAPQAGLTAGSARNYISDYLKNGAAR